MVAQGLCSLVSVPENLVFVSNCLSIVKCVTNSSVDRSMLDSVTEDIKFLARTLPSSSFIHVYRGANMAAHSLAKSCVSFSVLSRGVTPNCIREHICNDILVM
jgi:hypothetical protein